jgi:ribosome biogenesis GTPase A
MSVNWFPGHMVTAARQITQVLKRVDVVVEVRDARIPFSSSSPVLQAVLPHNMPLVVVLNKADLANANMSHRAVQMLGPDRTLLASCGGRSKGSGVSAVVPACLRVARPSRSGPLHVLVVGVPNAGKSSLINSLRGTGQAARQGPTPGLTRSIGTFQVRKPGCEPVYVVDSPGVLSPATDIDQAAGRNLAICGCVKDTAVRCKVVHGWLLQELQNRGRDVEALRIESVMRGAGPALDEESAALHVLTQFREGRLGQFTLDIF